jgi:hypothetical protein
VIARLRAFGDFWLDFVVGDDWHVAAGVLAALVITVIASTATSKTWWILPVVVVLLLPYSLWRATRPRA